MDLQGSLVDTNLKIYPTEKLITFLNSISLKTDIPTNILNLINKKVKPNSSAHTTPTKPANITITNEDIKNLNLITDVLRIQNPEIVTNKHDHGDDKSNEQEAKHATEPQNGQGDEKSTLKDESQNSDNESTETNPTEEKPKALTTQDIDWLYIYLNSQRITGTEAKSVPYLHELLEGASIEAPDNEIIKRNPELEARCVKLRAQQEAREYRKMTKGVDNVRIKFPEDSINFQLKQINRQLIAIGQFILSIFAGFLFGFKGIDWMVGPLDFGFRLLLGVMAALVIALAEIYFLAKKLNEEMNMAETVQLGGPPKFEEKNLSSYDRMMRDLYKSNRNDSKIKSD